MCKLPVEAPIEQQAPMQDAEHIQVLEPLNANMLAAASPQERNDMLGARIFPRILTMFSNIRVVGKITGMLLELNNAELLYLLDNEDALEDKVEEAVAVLQAHLAQQAATNEIK